MTPMRTVIIPNYEVFKSGKIPPMPLILLKPPLNLTIRLRMIIPAQNMLHTLGFKILLKGMFRITLFIPLISIELRAMVSNNLTNTPNRPILLKNLLHQGYAVLSSCVLAFNSC